MKLKAVPLFWESKQPKGAWKKDPSCLNQLDLKEFYKFNETLSLKKNHSLLTGKINNLFVLDIDCHKTENINDNLFIKTYGSDPKVWFEKFGALIVKTPSGGYHLYFQYTPAIRQGQDPESNIDTRTDGGLIVCPGSVLKKKKYTILHGDFDTLPQMSEELINFIHKIPYYDPTKKIHHQKPITITKTIVNKEGKKSIIIQEVLGCDQSLYHYDYPDDLLHNIIKNLPSEYQNTYDKYVIFTTALKQIGRKDIWAQYPKLNNPRGGDVEGQPHIDWMEGIWNNITGHRSILAMNHLLINSNYKDARTSLDYYKYKPILKNKLTPNYNIHREKLGYEFFDEINKKKYNVIKSDTGTGKTTSFKHFIKKNNKRKFISIVSRISLGLDQYETFNEFGIETDYYENVNFEPNNNYIVQIDSLLKLKWFQETGWLDDYDIFMDEFNSIIKHLFTSTTISKNGIRIPIMELLLDLLKGAKNVIMTDADISDQSLEFLEFINPEKDEINFIQNDYKHNQGKSSKEIFSYSELIDKMKKEDKFICACDEARSCHLIKEELKDEKILVIAGQGVNQNYNWNEYDKIIFSPKVIYGIDSTIERPVYCFYQESTIDPKDMLQQINRNRNITTLYYVFNRKKCRDTEFNTFQDAIDDSNDLLKICERNDYLTQEFHRVDPIFKKIFNQFKYNKDSYSSNPYAHFKNLLNERGFIDKTEFKQTDAKEVRKKLKEDKERQIELVNKDLQFVKEMNEYINLPEDEIINHKEIFLDRNFIHRFVNARHFLFEEYGEKYDGVKKEWIQDIKDDFERLTAHKSYMKNKIFEKQEFNLKKIKSSENQLIFLDKIKEELGVPERMKIEGIKTMNEEKAKLFLEEYKATFSDKSIYETNPLITEEGSQKLINKIYKKIFGDTPFTSSETSKNGKSIRTFQDGKHENMKYLNDVFKKTKTEYERKINEKYNPECKIDLDE